MPGSAAGPGGEHADPVRGDGPGDLMIAGLPPEIAEVLLAIPRVVDSDARPEIRSLLFPDPYDDEEQNDEWRRTAHPELAHLFATARQIVAADLVGLAASLGDPAGGRLVIPRNHGAAWISALQQCLQIVRSEYDFTTAELEGKIAPDTSAERREALWRVHALYAVQSILIDNENRGAPADG